MTSLLETLASTAATALVAALAIGPSHAASVASTSAPFTLKFSAVDGSKPVDCTSRLVGFGPDGKDTVGLNDLRFYVSDVRFIGADGASVPARLDSNDFQLNQPAGSVALVDLTGTSAGSCTPGNVQFGEGTARTNLVVSGMSPMANAKEVSFRIGVPQPLMQAAVAATSQEDAPSPLAEMYWNWATGYRHFVLNHTVDTADGRHGDGYVHIGSTGCGPADSKALGDRPRCDYVNTPLVRLPWTGSGSLSIGIDIRAILGNLPFVAPVYDQKTMAVIGQQPGTSCHSGMEGDCDKVFTTFGISRETGEDVAAADRVFKVLQ